MSLVGVDVMDHDEAIRLLKGGEEGIIVWNRLRKFDADIPTLHGVDLRGANLSGANLSSAQLAGARLNEARLDQAGFAAAQAINSSMTGHEWVSANLRGADLRHADLSDASLSEADLRDANLNGAFLNGTRLFYADVRGADLSGVKLWRANLCGASLKGAILTKAACAATTFANIDLSEVKDLDSVLHHGPSTVGIDTLFRSGGNIPEAFLLGCGVPPYLIENQKALIGSMEPIQFYSCFISHSSKDKAFAERLHSRMVQTKLRVWYAPEDMRGGKKSLDEIDQAIRVYDKLLLALSKASMQSNWVLHEIRRAVEREKRENRQVLFPIGIATRNAIREWSAFDSDSGLDLAKLVRQYHIPDFSKWKDHDAFEASFARLLKDLKTDESTRGKPG
jgi:hypothetical protein